MNTNNNPQPFNRRTTDENKPRPHATRTHTPRTHEHGTSPARKPMQAASFQYTKQHNRSTRRPPVAQSESSTRPVPAKPRGQGLPPVGNNIRIIPLGGVEEIGRNCTAIEIGNDIIVIDAGMQFKIDDTPGIDYMIPNTTYLEENKDRVRAMIVTHGHLDHIGGIPLVMSRIGNPPLYSRYLSILLMQKRQAEFPHLPALNMQTVEKDSVIMAGNIRVRFFGVTHTIPDSMGVIIETPHGSIVTPGDYKLDHIDGVPTDSEEDAYAFFDKENVLLLMTDSTNVDNEGFSLPEFKVHIGLDKLITQSTGRIIIAAFASHITRLIKIVEIAERLGKKVVLDGRSLKTNMEVCEQAGIFKPKKGTLIEIEEVENYPPHKVIILMTGAQGEEFAALNRAANKTHKKFSLTKGDTIILSASIVPGNELAVARLKDNLARQGVKIVSYRTSEETIHATGHGNQEDIKWLHRKTHPKFFIPIHGSHYMLTLHKELALGLGMSEENIIVPDNGSVIEIQDEGKKMVLLKEKVPSGAMMVDGFSVSDLQDVVLRDRQMLASDGVFVAFILLDGKTGKLKKSPDLISRGFVYLKENQELLRQTRIIIKKIVEDETARSNNPANYDNVKNVLGEQVSKYLYQKTAKRPLVIPVILSV